jgi:hypothetical protein
MKPWTREDTKEWIIQVENRLNDIHYFLNQTVAWCENQDIDNEYQVFMCSFLTCVWVSAMRDEHISYNEIMEILNVQSWVDEGEKIYQMDDVWLELDHQELLEKIVETCNRYNED